MSGGFSARDLVQGGAGFANSGGLCRALADRFGGVPRTRRCFSPLTRQAVRVSEPRRATDAHGSTSTGVARRFRWVAYQPRKRPDTGANASAPAAEERSTFAGTAL